MTLPIGHQQTAMSENLYKRLGVPESAGKDQIEFEFQKRYKYWMGIPPHHAKYGRDVDRYKSHLQEARDILHDPIKRRNYDNQIKEKQKQLDQEQKEIQYQILSHIVEPAVVDQKLTRVEKNTILKSGRELGLSDYEIENVIEAMMLKYNAIFVEEDILEPTTPTSSGRPKLILENLPSRRIDLSNIQINHKVEQTVTINNTGGGVNNGTITTNEEWLTVSQEKLDTRYHKQTFKIIINTHHLKLAHRYSGTVKIQTLGGTESITVILSIEGAKKRAQKMTKITTSVTAAASIGVWGYYSYLTMAYTTGLFFLTAFIVLVGTAGFSMIIKGKRGGYFWLILSVLTLGMVNRFVFILMVPVLLVRLVSYLIFPRFPTKTLLVAVIPLFLCTGFWGGYYWFADHLNMMYAIESAKSNRKQQTIRSEELPTATVIAPQGASVRSGPGKSYSRITALPRGKEVEILNQSGNWIQIQFGQNSQTGYIFKTLIAQSDKKQIGYGDTPVRKIPVQSKSNEKLLLQFESKPSAAKLYIDDRFVGKTPFTIKLSPGNIQLSLKKNGFVDFKKSIKIKKNGQTKFEFAMVSSRKKIIPIEKETPPSLPSQKTSNSEIIFTGYDEAPQPIGGFAEIHKNLKYPEIARKAGVEGRVFVKVAIDEKGNIFRTEIIKSLGNNGCDEAAVAAIKKVKWRPAKNSGKAVKVWISIPVIFKLK